jgi:glycosyltransferase involved in cell wall biosynthesis
MRVSVVILCKNQQLNLVRIVDALAHQTVRPEEVIVVDDRSELDLADFVLKLGCRYASTAPHVRDASTGARALARQVGLDEAQNPVVAYLDGDMIPARRFIESGLAGLRKAPLVKLWREFRVTTAGRILPLHGGGGRHARESEIEYSQFTSDFFVVRRDAALAVGGWDENFRGWGEEDVEFAYRFKLAGFRIWAVRSQASFATHIDHPIDPCENFRSLLRNARYFMSKFPQVAHEREPFWRSLKMYESLYR